MWPFMSNLIHLALAWGWEGLWGSGLSPQSGLSCEIEFHRWIFFWHVYLPDSTQAITNYILLDLKKKKKGMFFTAINQLLNGLDGRRGLSLVAWDVELSNVYTIVVGRDLGSFSPRAFLASGHHCQHLSGPRMCEQSRSWGTGTTCFLLSLGEGLAAALTGPTHLAEV